MKTFYKQGSADFPRLLTDRMFYDAEIACYYRGFLDGAIRYVEEFQLLDPILWRRFVEQFRTAADDADNGWRGEYWGKMMRGACFVYSYTKNEALMKTLTDTVRDMLDSEDENGRISAYPITHEFDGWDMWCRKYVLLGLQYYLEICRDEELKKRIIASMCRQTDYIISKIGDTNQKKLPITMATRHWRGLNSSSILEPIVRLYNLTGEKRYFDFATYIVECGGTDVANIFDLAYENDLLPYQYPVTKAYEMTSCFEGLLEYYRVTKNERYKTAILNFANRILESEFTVIGSSGCTHELFDHSFFRQANTTNNPVMQETCVTVTLMKFFQRLLLLTGESKFADAFEISMYNAFLGAINTEKKVGKVKIFGDVEWIHEPLPFDSYSPLTAGTRGIQVGGLKRMADGHYYGCCACIAPAGCGLIPQMHLLNEENGLVMSLFIDGTVATTTPTGHPITLETVTDYPRDGHVEIICRLDAPEAFTLKLRNPAWSKHTLLSVNGERISASEGFISITREWKDGDRITLDLDMRTEVIRPTPYGTDILMNRVVWGHNYMVSTFDREDPLAKHHIALRRGPLMLAQDNRLGYSVDTPIEVLTDADEAVAELVDPKKVPYPCIIAATVSLTDGSQMLVTDYASAGKTWNEESKMAVWMLTK